MMIERADEFRTRAMDRRNRGRHVGVSAKGWNVPRPALDPSDFQSHVIMALELWRTDKGEAINDFRAACLNGPGADNAIPF